MKILLLAPQPFYQERGTPIAVDLLARVLAEHGVRVHLLVFPEGRDVVHPGVRLERVRCPALLHGVGPGFSWRKLATDAFMMLRVLRIVSGDRPAFVWAVEESAFMALVVRALFGIPYVYDMDSSLARQLRESRPALQSVAGPLDAMERLAIRHAAAVAPVCEALAEIARPHCAGPVTVLHDVPQESAAGAADAADDLRRSFGIDGFLFVYVGNLEPYQGIDLLLDAFVAQQEAPGRPAALVLIGGAEQDLERYRRRISALGLSDRVHLAGPRPVAQLGAYLAQADALVSPRVRGDNTPMKLYSYLASGRPVLATDLPTHTQVVGAATALLAAPRAGRFAAAMRRLVDDPELCRELGAAGSRLVAERYGATAYRRKVGELLRRLGHERDGAAVDAVPHEAAR